MADDKYGCGGIFVLELAGAVYGLFHGWYDKPKTVESEPSVTSVPSLPRTRDGWIPITPPQTPPSASNPSPYDWRLPVPPNTTQPVNADDREHVQQATPDGSPVPNDPSPAILTSPRATSFRPMSFDDATHKGRGGCTGHLDLTSAGLHFSCPTQPDIDIPLDAIEDLASAGKSLWLCYLAGSYLRRKLNVVYLGLEMGQEVIERRIFANLLNIALDIESGPMVFDEDVEVPDGLGTLRIKAFPSGMAHAGDFRSFITGLDFKPDVILVDYLGICASETMTASKQQTYAVVNSIAIELRALAHQTDAVIWTGAQANRAGARDGEIDLTHTADSYQITNHADIILSIWVDEQIPGRPYHCKVLKHQTGAGQGEHGMFSVNRSKMRVYDIMEADAAAGEEVKQNRAAIHKKPTKAQKRLTV